MSLRDLSTNPVPISAGFFFTYLHDILITQRPIKYRSLPSNLSTTRAFYVDSEHINIVRHVAIKSVELY